MRGDTTHHGPITTCAAGRPPQCRARLIRLPPWSNWWVGLCLLGLIVTPWLGISAPPDDAALGKRASGVGDSAVLTFAFSRDGAVIAAIQTDGRVGLRRAVNEAGGHAFLDYRGQAHALAFSPDGRSLAVGGTEPDIWLFDVAAAGPGRPLGIPVRSPSVKGMAFSPDGRLLAVATWLDHDILLWDLAAGRERARLRGHSSPVTCLAFSPDGRSLASGSHGGGAVVVWDLRTRQPRRRLDVPPRPLTSLSYSPDGRWLASTGDRGCEARLWDLGSRRGDRMLGPLSQAREPLAFSPDGRLLAGVGPDGIVRLCELETGAELSRFGGAAERLSGVAFSPDGRLLAASGNDPDIRLTPLTLGPAHALRDGPRVKSTASHDSH